MLIRWLGPAVVAVTIASCDKSPSEPESIRNRNQDETEAETARGGRAAATMTVFVSSQGLHYDTFVAKDPLPMEGEFQLLENGVTEFGPGDPEYLGGRWWEDLNHNGTMDPADHYFLCPLLPPGRSEP